MKRGRLGVLGLMAAIGCGGEVPADGAMQRIELDRAAIDPAVARPGDITAIDPAVAGKTTPLGPGDAAAIDPAVAGRPAAAIDPTALGCDPPPLKPGDAAIDPAVAACDPPPLKPGVAGATAPAPGAQKTFDPPAPIRTVKQ